MKKLFVLLFISCAGYASACTNFIVGKNASADGSVFCTYSADSYGLYAHLRHYPAGTHAKGEVVKIYDYDTNVCHGEIPQAPVTYNVVGNINEYQVSIGETTFGGREEMVDTTGIIDYGSLMYITLQRSKSAREAISVMTSLVEKYGYCSEGETFTICDPNEAWIMDMMGAPGSKPGVVWVAIRIPDDAICAHANQSRITTFNQKDKENVLYSKNVIKYARQKGWFNGKDSEFSFNAAYAAPDFLGRRVCEARVWSFFRHFSNDMDRYLPYVEGKGEYTEAMPLWIIPNRKLTLQDVQECMRDHFEGTPFSLDSDMGQGIWEMPYRPTPLYFKVDGKKYFNERPTSTQQTGFTYVAQLRSFLPREVGGVLWFGNDDSNMIAYTPIYCCSTRVPECYDAPGADAVTFSDKSAFWVCNWVSNMVYPRYSMLFPSLREVRDSLERRYFSLQQAVERKAIRLLAESNDGSGVEYLTQYSVDKAQDMLECWRNLATYLIVKYNDMAVKPEKNGKFQRTPEGLGADVARPGYSEKIARELIKQTGDRYAMPEEKK
ncbi:MAG: C69 family dipeptidase [Prevotella sp.]|nr:C69 family dipeptidase [Prevotella sp.]